MFKMFCVNKNLSHVHLQLAGSYEVPNFKFQKTLLEKSPSNSLMCTNFEQLFLKRKLFKIWIGPIRRLNEAIFAAVANCLNLMSENACMCFPNSFCFLCRADYNIQGYNFFFIN